MRDFSKVKRVVVKIGSSTITHENGLINLSKVDRLAWELANLKNNGFEVCLVSSGSIVAGANRMRLSEKPKTNSLKQAASSIGQVTLMNTYNRAFSEYGYLAAQFLLTNEIETNKTMRDNAIATFHELMTMNAIPVVNENDTISTNELGIGDNDTLSAWVARLISADLLILISDVEGLYDDDPNLNPQAKLISEVNAVDEQLLSFAKNTHSAVGTGGMITKLRASALCLERGIDMVITKGEDMKVIHQVLLGKPIGTLFHKES